MGPFRVWAKGKQFPGLAISRSIGDKNGKECGIICDPGYLINRNFRKINYKRR